jgi:hypothetical protein
MNTSFQKIYTSKYTGLIASITAAGKEYLCSYATPELALF